MAPDRRSVLKAIGTASAAATVPVSTAIAEKDGCTETIEEFTISEAAVPIAGTPSPVATFPFVFYTEPFTVSGFEKSELEGQRVVATLRWHYVEGTRPTDAGPTGADFYLDRRALDGSWDGQAHDDRAAGFTENKVEIQAVDGNKYSGPQASGARDDADETPIVIQSGEEYRFAITALGPIAFNIDATFETFDPACLDESSE